MPGSALRRRIGQVALLLGSALVSVALADGLLRWLTPDAWYVWPPNYRHVFQPDSSIMPGVSGESVFRVNADGMRGDPLPDDDRYRLLAVGGSTTECSYLDDSEAWPALVQQGVNQALGRDALWVGNVGRAGNNSVHNALQVEKLLAQYPSEIDAVILLVGLNDLLWRLSFESEPAYRHQHNVRGASLEALRRAFSVFPGHDDAAPWYRRTGFERFWRTVRWRSFGEGPKHAAQDEFGAVYEVWRTHRREAPEILTALPSLDSAIDRYLRNIERVAAASRDAGARVLFATQPAIWRADLPDDLVALLWMGGIGRYMAQPGSRYYAPAALAGGLDRFNAVLRNRARELGIEVVDLAAELPRDASVFFDDAHFNEPGAARVGRSVSKHLLERPPFVAERDADGAKPSGS